MIKYLNDYVGVCPATVTDERMVVDVLVPGFGKDDITVRACKIDGGDTFALKVKGVYSRRTNKEGAVIPKLSFEKRVQDFKLTITSKDCSFVGDHFATGDFVLDDLKYDVTDGVLRISVGKTAAAIGTVIEAVENADADSTGDTGATDSD